MRPMPTQDQVIGALRSVIDPELRRDIVELEMVRSVDLHDNGVVDVMVSLTTPGCPIRSHFQTGVTQAIGELEGVAGVNVSFDVLSDHEKAALGRKVGRGPMLHKALQQFLEDVEWGELDYLLIDLPPGTGDVSMTLAQLLPQAKFLIVTTPQPVAQKVARRSAEMAAKLKLEIAGVIENMSGFVTPGGERYQLFGEGGGQLLAEELDVPLLAKIPLTVTLREQSDAGVPVVYSDPEDPAAQALKHGARGLIALSPIELPVMQAPAPAAAPKPVGMSLPMA